MIQQAFVKKNSYQDSVKLMQLTEQVKVLPGIVRATAIMGTENNRATARRAGFGPALLKDAGPNDVLFLVAAKTHVEGENAWTQFQAALDQHSSSKATETPVSSIKRAASLLDGANLAIISVPGEYAAYEAFRALRENMHVHIFSDNVSLEDEVKLKELGRQKELLVMGPDCGTSIIAGVPICFANVVTQGAIGIVGASGTGIQEVSVIIDRLGAGVSHAIGVGGRDLSDTVGGISSQMALRLLDEDPATEVIVLLSKPPGLTTQNAITQQIQTLSKPVVVCFLGEGSTALKGARHVADTLEQAAVLAVDLSKEPGGMPSSPFIRHFAQEFGHKQAIAPSQRQYIRALYSGGTLAAEAQYLMQGQLGCVEYNPEPGYTGHAVIDLGDDQFTQGRPHPMIDPSYRAESLVHEWADPEVAVILLDLVLGYGSHDNPAAPLADAILEARTQYGDVVTVVASICGTDRDPQNFATQKSLLEDAGVFVFPTNAYATEAAIQLLMSRRRVG